MIINSKLLKIW